MSSPRSLADRNPTDFESLRTCYSTQCPEDGLYPMPIMDLRRTVGYGR